MRDLSKMMDMIIEKPDSTNEYILNSAGLKQGMSTEEVLLENACLNAIRKLSPGTISKLKQII